MRRFALLLSLLVGCGGGGHGPTVSVTSPTGFGQLVPGGHVDVAWQVSGAFDPPRTSVVLVSRDDQAPFPVVDRGTAAAGTTIPTAIGFTWGGLDLAGHALPPGYYDLAIDLGAGDGLVDAGDSHIVVVQGLVFTAPAPGGAPVSASSAAPAALDFLTSTVSTLDVTLSITAGATAIPIKTVPVPGELRTVARTITWAATDAGGAAVPPGSYTMSATVTDAAAQATYTVAGGTVTVP